jgi:hypothetical protein
VGWAQASLGQDEIDYDEVVDFRAMMPGGIEEAPPYTVQQEFDWADACGLDNDLMDKDEFGYMLQFVSPSGDCPTP